MTRTTLTRHDASSFCGAIIRRLLELLFVFQPQRQQPAGVIEAARPPCADDVLLDAVFIGAERLRKPSHAALVCDGHFQDF